MITKIVNFQFQNDYKNTNVNNHELKHTTLSPSRWLCSSLFTHHRGQAAKVLDLYRSLTMRTLYSRTKPIFFKHDTIPAARYHLSSMFVTRFFKMSMSSVLFERWELSGSFGNATGKRFHSQVRKKRQSICFNAFFYIKRRYLICFPLALDLS